MTNISTVAELGAGVTGARRTSLFLAAGLEVRAYDPAGSGLRWAAMGPQMLFHPGAGEGGLLEFRHRYRHSLHRCRKDLGDIRLTPELAQSLLDGVNHESAQRSNSKLSRQRDDLIFSFVRDRHRLDHAGSHTG